MKKIFIVALLLAGAGTAQATTDPCNPATGNWENAATSTCRFMSPHNPDQPVHEIKEVPVEAEPEEESVPR
jgi:hypothetical protein